MKQYSVKGMSCAACSAKVEKAVLKVEGVKSCSVSLLTNSMLVDGEADEKQVIKAVTDAGYGAGVKDSENKTGIDEDELKDRESPRIMKRLIASLVFLLPLMYVSMGHMMWDWPIPGFLKSPLASGIYQMFLAMIVMVINQKFFIKGFMGLWHKAPNMDTLISLGSMASFLYSLVTLFRMADYPFMALLVSSGSDGMNYMQDLYFESAAMILTLITVGKYLEARSKGKTTDALKGLMSLAPKKARLIKDGREIDTDINLVKVGDLFAVKAGENVPVDGEIVEGFCAIDEAALTGESVPVDKKEGDMVYAATTNRTGYIVCKATRVGEDTTLSNIIKLVSDAAAGKAPVAKMADRVSGIFVPTVLGISLLTFIIWLLFGKNIGYSLTRAVAVLVISCPCALGLATPVAIMVGNTKAAKSGILFKTALSLEETGKVDIVALDKTGTVTKGEPVVTSLFAAGAFTEEELLFNAYSIEKRSIHPLSLAVVSFAESKAVTAGDVTEFETFAGLGIKGLVDGKRVLGGNYEFIKDHLQSENPQITDELAMLQKKTEDKVKKGNTPIFFTLDGRLLGTITVADAIKEDSRRAVEELKALGLEVVMLTGDNEKTAAAMGESVGVDSVVANVKPEGKENIIRQLQKFGKVAMVGDGINDAPALTRADIGIAIGAGTDIAIDAADLVLMKSSLLDVAAAIRLSRYTLINIRENLFWAFFFNIIGIPLAAGMWIPLTGWTLKPVYGAAAMSLSSFIVVSNALRINFFNAYESKKVIKRKSALSIELININPKEETEMEIIVKGMMCHHCEAHMKAALEKIDGVVEAVANHEAELVTIKTDKEVSEEAIKAAVAEAGYEYGGIK